jgi:putative aldouronate transport system substrate-binding protein
MKKALVLILCFCLVASILTGCTTAEKKETTSKIEVGEEIYPVSSEDTITYWTSFSPQLKQYYENFGETPLAKALEERTGIKVQYMHSEGGSTTEQINLMMASGELPDMVQYDWNYYSGGPQLAIDDDIIISLNDYIKEYAPHFYNYLQENKDVDKSVKTDSGNYYTVPFIRSKDWLCTYTGLILRKDWLDKVSMDEPKTIDEFEAVLKAYKEQCSNGVPPLLLQPKHRSVIMYAYGIGDDFYVDDGVVKYGPYEKTFGDVIKKMKEWYDNGILDADFATADSKRINADILNNKIGAFYGAVVGGMGAMLDAAKASNSDLDLVGIQQIALNGGEVPEYSAMGPPVYLAAGTAISANCKNVGLALLYLNYGFTDEGHMLYNFGIEGESYNMIDGEPVLSELLTNNPEGLSISAVAPRYLRASSNGPFIQDERYVKQSFAHPRQQQDAYDKWSKTNMKKHLYPHATLLPEELDEASGILANVKTYVDEMFLKFVTDKEPIENLDKYYEQLRAFDIEKLIDMKQRAYERFNKR